MRDAVQCSEVNEIHGRILSTVVGDDYVGKEVPHILLEIRVLFQGSSRSSI